jgi:putative ABC transport system permease protein
VVRHIKHYGVDQDSRESIYLPFEQNNRRGYTLVVRTKGEPMNIVNPIRHEIALMDNELPIANIQTLMDINIDRSSGRRFFATLMGVFALTALFLAALGIYGVISYSVAQRYHEIGIRMAMGAKVSDVLWLVLKKGLSLAGIGVFVGLLGSLALNRFISSRLFGVSGFDPLTYTGVSILLIAVALLACYLPARKASKVDPMVTLRCE